MKIALFILLILACLFSSCAVSENYDGDHRIVVTSPEVAEILASLGLDEFIVGVAAECQYPSVLQTKEIVGSFGGINFEKVLNLNPTVVYTSLLEQEEIAENLKKFGIKTISYYPSKIEDLIQIIREIANDYDRLEKAEEIIEEIKQTLSGIDFDEDNRPRVYLEIYNNPVMSVSDDSFVGELIAVAGGKNIFPQLPRDYSRVNVEHIIKANPQIIIITYPIDDLNQVLQRKGWSQIDAIKKGNVFTVDDVNPDLILRAGPRFAEGVRELYKVFYELKKY